MSVEFPPGPEVDIHLARPAASGAPGQDVDLEVLAAYLRRAGFRVSLLDACALPGGLDQLLECLRGTPARLIYWHLPSVPSLQSLLEASEVEDLGALAAACALGMMAGGYTATHHAEQILRRAPFLGAVVLGELELPIEWLLRHAAKRGRGGAPSLARRGSGGRISTGPPHPESPLPAHRWPAAAEDLLDPDLRRNGQKVLFSRGCRSSCGYCGFGPYFETFSPSRKALWRARPAAHVADEIEALQGAHGLDFFVFQAEVFFGYDRSGSDAVESLCREILRRGLEIRFKIVSHPGHLVRNADLVSLLKRAGLERVFLGVDSGSDATLRRFGVEFVCRESLEALRLLHLHDVQVTPGFIFYEPYMTPTNLASQIQFLYRSRPFFDHLPSTFARLLDRHILGRVLEIKPSMPMSDDLERDGLLAASESPPWTPSVARFKSPEVAGFFRVHQRVHRQILAKLRPLLWNRACVSSFPDLDVLPLDLLEHLRKGLIERRTITEREALPAAFDLVRKRLQGSLRSMVEVASLSDRHRERVAAVVRVAAAVR